MTIDRDGNIVPGQTWWYSEGALIEDKDNPYNIDFFIGVPYNDTQKAQFAEIQSLKKHLRDTDYQAIKYTDGEYTEEEYAPKRAQRAAWRAEIRRIEADFVKPTLTREEMDEAERKAMDSLKQQIELETGKEVKSITGGEVQNATG